MASRFKEDEKNERIIRGLLKLPDNKRCINCNSLGTQYVCTTFWTFVCTNCSGIHREFTHRVKSVSMATFTSQEVAALQEGGNQRAKEIYFKEWDPQRNSLPDSSNVDRLRDFIKHVYVDRRYTGEKNSDRPPRTKMGDKEDSYENRRTDGYPGGSRSPPYADNYDRHYSDRSSPGARSDDRNYRYNYDERRSPGYESDYRRTPARPEVVNDWHREDRFGNGRKLDDRGTSDGDSKPEGRSPERTRDLGSSSPPVVRPIREILGENVIPIRISEPPKANGSRIADGPAHAQRTASSNSLAASNGNPVEAKVESTGSLIDFDAEPEPPVSLAVPQAQQTISQSPVHPPSNSHDNWASFDFAPEAKGSQGPANMNTFDSVLSQLSVPTSAAGHQAGAPGVTIPVAASTSNISLMGAQSDVIASATTPFSGGAPSAQASDFTTFTPGGSLGINHGLAPSMPMVGGNSHVNVNTAGQWPGMPQQQSLFPAPASQSISQQFMPPTGASNNQPWNFPQGMQGPSSILAVQAPQSNPKSVQDVTSGTSRSSTMETKPIGRKELPADLFMATYPTFAAPGMGWQAGPPHGLGWQAGPPHGLGFPMQYCTPLQVPTFPQTSRSINPFDSNSEPIPARPQTFPSMAPLQGALPNAPPPAGLLGTSSLGTPSPAWMPPLSMPYASGTQTHPPAFAPASPPGAYAGVHVPSNIPPTSHQTVSNEASAGLLSFGQQLPNNFVTAPRPYPSVGGNPFG